MKLKKAVSALVALVCATTLLPWSSVVVATATDSVMYTANDFEVTVTDGCTYVDGVLIVNKSYSVPDSYSPSGLVSINKADMAGGKASQQMNSEAYEAFKKMRDVAASDGSIMALTITSAYRSISTQESLYNSYVKASGQSNADTYSARPGHSEHHTGLAIDICSADSTVYESNQDYIDMAAWLKDNCCDYGFIVRYPEGKDSVTGYKYEPWHLRYLGDVQLCKDITAAGTIEEYYGISSKYGQSDTFSNAEQLLQGELQAGQENEITAELNAPEQMIVDSFSASQKESYMILANKYMTETELQAMEWNLILSQFAIPYRESIQDVWNHTSFKDMREKGLTVDDNPYITTIKSNLNALEFEAVKNAIDLGIDITSSDTETITTKMNEIAEVMMEDNVVSYSMVYNGDSLAYVSDLFNIDTSTLTIKDKVAVTGDAANKTDMWDALQSMQDNYLVESKTKEQLATDVTSGSTVFDIEMPVWISTDSTTMYNAIYVANAIRIGGYGSFENFINSVKNSQLYMDRWGNLCAYLKIEGEYRYVIVYPAYSNPIFTSTELADTDFAGYVYEDFTSSDFWTYVGSSLDGYTNAGENNPIREGLDCLTKDGSEKDWGSTGVFGINPANVAKTYAQIKENYLTGDINALTPSDFLGVEGSDTVDWDLATTSKGKHFGGTYSRVRSGYSQSRDLIPIMEVDTTTNMLFNKAILSAYTHDSRNKVVGTDSVGNLSTYYRDNWYSCLNDSSTTYSAFSLASQYNKNNKEALFSNSIVFDKYYTNIVVAGKTNSAGIRGVYAMKGDTKYALQESTTAIAVSGWNYSGNNDTGKFTPAGFTNPYIFKSVKSGLKIIDTTSTADDVVTLYPWMQMHTYRKGLYSDNPTLQATKTKGFIIGDGINTVIEDRYVSKSWNFENVITTDADHYRSGTMGGRDTQIPIEIYWNAMYTDSDKFKTYVIFNYTSEAVPSNSVIYGLGYRLTKKNQGDIYYIASYMDDNLDGSKAMGRIYMSIPLLDATLDTAESWSIWTDPADDGFIDSIQEGPRTRPMPTASSAGGIAEYEQGMFFEPVEIDGSSSANALRFVLNDQRVSDVLENYPLEDITLLSFVWRNYYTPQTPFRTKLNSVIASGDTSKPYKLEDDSSITFAIGEDSYLEEGTVLTPGNVIASDSTKVNNTLVWTNSCSMEQESKLSPGAIGAGEGNLTGIGEVDSLGVNHTTIYRVSYNFGLLLLAVNKNTQGDNLTNLIAGYDAASEFNTDDIMSNIAYFFEHPVLAISNIFMGFVQMIHNNVAVGNVGNIFDISWVIDLAVAKGVMRWYMAMSATICCVILVIRGLGFMFNRKQKLGDILREWLSAICLSTVPVILLYTLSDGLKLMSTAMTKNVAGSLAAVEIEKEITSSENLNLNFETVYAAYKEQFAGIEDNYAKLSLQVPYRWNATLNQMEYTEVTVRELYDSTEYSNMLSAANLEASALEASAPGDATITNMYDQQSPAVNHLYYTYSEFVPVNYEKYSTNIFYYFYDYIKYQYLAYWAAQSDGNSAAFSAAAKNFSLPDATNNEKWSTYVSRMWDAERYMLLKSYNGMYIMLHDDQYTYNKLYDNDGDAVYRGAYPTDMFGLSYLFNMTNLSANQLGYTGIPSQQYFSALSEDNQMLAWKNNVQIAFDQNAGTYSSLSLSLMNSERRNKTSFVTNFYPLAYLMDNPAWQLIKQNNTAVTRNPSSGDFADYRFTPTYLEDELKEQYEPYIDLSLINGGNVSSFATSDVFDFDNISSSRLPWRVYASKSLLYGHTFDGDSYDTKVTDFEVLLMKCNEDAFKKVKELTEYLQGDIRDSSLIFAAALIATMEFNETFSGNVLVGDQLEPRSFTADSMDLDKFMRVTYARSMDEIVKNTNVMYMIYEQEGGIVTAIIVALTEVMIAITMLARIGVLILLLLGCAYVCFCYAFHKHKERQAMLVGLLSQLLQIIASQFILMLVVTQSMAWISETNTTITRLLVALLSLICCFALTRWSLYMLFALIKDFKNFGGAIIQGSVNTAMSRVQSAFSDIKNNNQLKNLNASIQNANVGERTLAGSGVGGATLARRVRNAGKVYRANKQISDINRETKRAMKEYKNAQSIPKHKRGRNLARHNDPETTTTTPTPSSNTKPAEKKPATTAPISKPQEARRQTQATPVPKPQTQATPVPKPADNSARIRELQSQVQGRAVEWQAAQRDVVLARRDADAMEVKLDYFKKQLSQIKSHEDHEMLQAKYEQTQRTYAEQLKLVKDYEKQADNYKRNLESLRNQIDTLKGKK